MSRRGPASAAAVEPPAVSESIMFFSVVVSAVSGKIEAVGQVLLDEG